jgi:outer membrane protein OmpA-like peptidoglycan-associated protein
MLSGRVSENEARIGKAEGQIGQLGGRMTAAEGKLGSVEGKLTGVEGKVGEVDGKAERALTTLGNLKLERRLVVDMKEGANFGFNSAALPPQARKEIDGFLSDLKGDAEGTSGLVFVLAGHTDNLGNESFNFALAKLRAENTGNYLTSTRKIDPSRLAIVSYGETAPVADNITEAGRAKNRRVEILVYRDAISVGSPGGQSTVGR